MKTLKALLIPLLLLTIFVACSDDDSEVDKEKPTIDLSIDGAFPVNCETIYFGEEFELKMRFTDNVELGSYSIDIHNNFDHHSHSTEVTECELDPVKTPINPFVFIDDYTIPEGSDEYVTSLRIFIPANNDEGDYDDGDYHFFISLTDKEGWSAQKGLSIKMRHR
ncbi:DUF4625 domain-containing protein [Carboxylicivirga sp. A043]|uniref:DUF4625 domain-containing protein n=1 Tax=Carboxylicivirga litoralis TaxID=2816963 RepID=UPI0021CB6BFC|nr:DUF4625 domain-containing protein [Carboxylicivirga sp. A043]MCU4158333.1 DUF4625 domain-containing protein [Carboxylicivirga sp. A043]